MSQADRFCPYAAVYLVLLKDGQALFLKRVPGSYQAGNYSLVAGHLDGDESATQAMIREAKEEAAIILKPEYLEVVHVMHRISSDREYIDLYLKAEKWEGEIINMEPAKCDELKWLELNNLPENIVPEVRLAFENISKNIHYSEFGWNLK